MYCRRLAIKEEKPVTPNNIKNFGYFIEENGEIRDIHGSNNMSNMTRVGH